MLRGNLTLEGASFVSNAILLISFISVVLCLAQDEHLDIPALDVIQTIFCWPSVVESVLISVLLYLLRDVERVMGYRSLMYLLGTNLVTFLPAFLVVLILEGFACHFSLLFFVPYSIFVYTFDKIPETRMFWEVTDKHVVLVLFCLIAGYRAPESILCLISAVFGYIIWRNDWIKLRNRW